MAITLRETNGKFKIYNGRKIVLGVPRKLEDCLKKFEEHTGLSREVIQNLKDFQKPEQTANKKPYVAKIYELRKTRSRGPEPKYRIYKGSEIILGQARTLEDCLKKFEGHTGESRDTVNMTAAKGSKPVKSNGSAKVKGVKIYSPNPRVFALMNHNNLGTMNAEQAKAILDERFATPTSPDTAEKYLQMAIKYA